MNSVITEITETNGGCVFYDAQCRFCTTWARRGERWLGKRGFRFAPLSELADELKLVTGSGETIGGARAVVYLARQIWWAWPLWAISRDPGVMRQLECVYRRFSSRRNCPLRTHERRELRSLTRRWSW